MNRTKRILFLAAALVAFSLLPGCVRTSNKLVPKTSVQIKEDPKSKTIWLEFPKDMTIGFAQFTKSTNGQTSLVLSNLVSLTNPDVIKEAGNAQAAAFAAMADLYRENLKLVRELLEKGAKTSAGVPGP